ncbi:MAG TPA: tetratricopeptide repeat protein [Steroidobacteraceae bacterium]|nr:tetratricopeptide repeat protein [Steroidobacteraceae bacterium]
MDQEKKDRELFSLAQRQSRQGDTEGVVRTMRQLVNRRPKSGIFAAVLANALKSLGHMDEAERYFKSAVVLSPKSEKVSLGLFHCLWERGKEDEALEEMKRLVRTTKKKSDEYQVILDALQKSD